MFVEGNAELTPARLAGHFDPAQVLSQGYTSKMCTSTARSSMHSATVALLYVEEINRVPEETLNLLVTVMSEAELTVPRLGHDCRPSRIPARRGHESIRRCRYRPHCRSNL